MTNKKTVFVFMLCLMVLLVGSFHSYRQTGAYKSRREVALKHQEEILKRRNLTVKQTKHRLKMVVEFAEIKLYFDSDDEIYGGLTGRHYYFRRWKLTHSHLKDKAGYMDFDLTRNEAIDILLGQNIHRDLICSRFEYDHYKEVYEEYSTDDELEGYLWGEVGLQIEIVESKSEERMAEDAAYYAQKSDKLYHRRQDYCEHLERDLEWIRENVLSQLSEL